MKTLFLKTSALAGALLLAAPAFAAGPKIIVGGEANFQTGFSSQDGAFETGTFSRDYNFSNMTEIHFDVEGKSEGGLGYGAHIELEADVNADARGEGLNADKTYLWLEGGMGRVEMGNNEGAEAAMAVNAAGIARGTGGIDGDDEFYINSAGALGTAAFLIHPDLYSANVGGITEDATKLTYYSPEFSGFQLGASFTPDEGDGGTAAGFTGDTNGDMENVIGLGLNWSGDFDSVSVALGAVGEFGSAEVSGTEDLAAWQLGASVSFGSVSVAGSYGDLGDSGQAVGSGIDTSFWTAGAAYENGPWGVSATYLNSEVGSNDYSSIALGADYALAPGLTPYIDVSFFEADEGGTTVDNDGTIVLVGTYLNF